MADIEITPKLLAELKAKAEDATQDEWPYDASYLMEDSDMAYVFCVKNIYDVSYIAAVNPHVVLALVEYIRKLESQLSSAMNANGEAQEIMAEIEQDKSKMEKEAYWLADRLKNVCHKYDMCGMADSAKCPFYDDGKFKCYSESLNWREAAHKAIEDKNV